MKAPESLRPSLSQAIIALAFLGAASADAQFPGQGDDTTASLGGFRLVINPAFQGLFAGYPGYNGATKRLDSPTLYDPVTVIGRSSPHLDGDAADTGGTPVGTTGTMVSDSSFALMPAGFVGPAGTREVHTQIRDLNMTFGPVAVRAGLSAPGRPASFGEVQSNSGNSGNPSLDFPASSFFDVFVEVDLPGMGAFPGGTVYNTTPLLVENNNLLGFPPTVVYIHGNSSAVPVVFANDTAAWDPGDILGLLLLAGHGVTGKEGQPGTGPDPADEAAFESILSNLPEAAVDPQYLNWAPGLHGVVPEPGTYPAVGLIGLLGAAWYVRRRQG